MINVNMTDKAGVTLATAGKYCADNVKVTPSADILRKDEQAKTATPTTSAQDITPDAGKALSKVTVNPITAAIVGDLDADSFASAIVAAIEGKGVTVPSGAKLSALAELVESIEAGVGSGNGGGIPSPFTKVTTGTVLYASLQHANTVAFNHGLGVAPKIFVVYLDEIGSYSGGSINVIIYVDHQNTFTEYVGAYSTCKSSFGGLTRSALNVDSESFCFNDSYQYYSSNRTFRWVAIA